MISPNPNHPQENFVNTYVICQQNLQTLYIPKFQKKVDAPKRSEKEKETGKKLKSSQEEKEKSTKEKQNVKKSSNDNATAVSNVVEEISAPPSSSLADINEEDELSSKKQHLSQNPTTVSFLCCTKVCSFLHTF